jgi:hypothetical protein
VAQSLFELWVQWPEADKDGNLRRRPQQV